MSAGYSLRTPLFTFLVTFLRPFAVSRRFNKKQVFWRSSLGQWGVRPLAPSTTRHPYRFVGAGPFEAMAKLSILEFSKELSRVIVAYSICVGDVGSSGPLGTVSRSYPFE